MSLKGRLHKLKGNLLVQSNNGNYIISVNYIFMINLCCKIPMGFTIQRKISTNRLKKHKLTVNPNICFIGMPEVDCFSHTIKERGMSFSRWNRRTPFW